MGNQQLRLEYMSESYLILNIGDIYNSMNSDKYVNSRVNKSFYEMVRRIRKHEIFNNISCNYVF